MFFRFKLNNDPFTGAALRRLSIMLLAFAVLISAPACIFAEADDGAAGSDPAAVSAESGSDAEAGTEAQADEAEETARPSDEGAPANEARGLRSAGGGIGAMAVGPQSFGTGLCWEIDDSGKLTIRPEQAGTEGILPQASGLGGNPPSASQLATYWGWLADEYRSQIKSVKIEEGVGASDYAELRYMFYGLTNLTDVDMSGLKLPGRVVMNDMFRGCSSLKEVTIAPQNLIAAQINRMFKDCTALEKVTLGSVENPLNTTNLSQLNEAFSGCSALKELCLPGINGVGGGSNKNVRMLDLVNTFYNSNSNLKTLRVPDSSFDSYLARQLFKNDRLETADLTNAEVKTPYLRELFHNVNSSKDITDYNACPKLKTVIMNGAKFPEKGTTAWRAFMKLKSLETVEMENVVLADETKNVSEMFRECSALKNVKMGGLKAVNAENASMMFQSCTSLESVDLSGVDMQKPKNLSAMFENCSALTSVLFGPKTEGGAEIKMDKAVSMTSMFKACSALTELDLSSFGKLENIVNMDGFVQSCTSLETLNVDNLDNSNIEDRRSFHPAWDHNEDARSLGVDWGRELGLDSCKSLTTLSAKNSKLWMAKNTKGSAAGGMHYNAESDKSIYYFTEKQMSFESDKGPAVNINTHRNWVDLLTDRHEDAERANGKNEKDGNINLAEGKRLNGTNGAGFLAPGVYRIKNSELTDEEPPFQDSYYRICDLSEKTPEVSFDESKFMLIEKNSIYGGPAHNSLDTVSMTGPEIRSFSGYTASADDPLITVTYKDGAKDINGITHDVQMKITAIRFNDLDKIPEEPNPYRDHDVNPYVYEYDYYTRAVLEYDKGYVGLKNYIFSTDGYRRIMMKSSSGMEIDYVINVVDALPDTSVLFYADDLDVPAGQNWIKGKNPDGHDDACYDELPWQNVQYGEGSEGVKLGAGNDLNTLKFAEHSGLEKIGDNYIVGTGTDPSTAWSAFSVRANAKGSKYTWTSGIGCTTEVLKETPGAEKPKPVYIIPEGSKLINGTVPKGLYSNLFDFSLAPATEVTLVAANPYGEDMSRMLENSATGEQASGAKNDEKTVPFKELSFESPGSQNNVNLAKAYVYKVTETKGDRDDITYNSGKVVHFIKVVVSNPLNDLEMEKGTKAVVTTGEYHYEGEAAPESVPIENIVWNVEGSRTVWSSDAQPSGETVETSEGTKSVFIDGSGKKFYREGGKYRLYPSGEVLKVAQNEQEDRKVEYPAGSGNKYQVRIDKNGVKYIKVMEGLTSTKYLDPDDGFRQLRVSSEGEIYPDDGDSAAVTERKASGGETVKVDVHGKKYFHKSDGKYYDADDESSELTVKDGVFNPCYSSDRTEYAPEMVTDGGASYPVYTDSEGNRYYKKGDKYYDPDNIGHELSAGSKGEVSPSVKDKKDTTDKKEDQFMVIRGHKVYSDVHGIRYYKAGGKYYDVVGTILAEEEGVFEPDPNKDEEVILPFDIMQAEIDGKTVKFYKSEGNYYLYKEKDDFSDATAFSFPADLLDTSEAIDAGSFNNGARTADICIEKKTENGKAGDFDFYISFDNGFHPSDVVFTQGRPLDGEFDEVTSGEYKGAYKFTLSEGQKVVIKGVPLFTTYTVTEPFEANGWELSGITSLEAYDSSNPDAKITQTDTKTRSVSRTIETEDSDYYKHSFKNRFTELTVDKTVSGETDPSKTFEFEADVSVEGLEPNEEFSYGWMQQAESRAFYKGTADSEGKATVNMSFELKHGEDIALVVPDGAKVKVTEDTQSYIAFVKEGSGAETKGNSITKDSVKDDPRTALHFRNQYVTPVDYSDIRVEKFISNHSFMNGYSFEMALLPGVPDEPLHTPLPSEVKTLADEGGVYSPAVVRADESKTADKTVGGTTLHGYYNNFGKITFTNEDMVELVDGKWTQVSEKTFKYRIRELKPQERGAVAENERTPGITYSDEIYVAEVKVKLNEAEAKLELVVEDTSIYKAHGDYEYDRTNDKVSVAEFTNSYDPNKSAYRMAADKILTSTDDTWSLKNEDYTFIMKPVGENSDKAPMPKDKQPGGSIGTETVDGERIFRAKNTGNMIRFLNNDDPEDGLWFDHATLNDAGFSDEDLSAGVTFSYEIYEEIPEAGDGEELINNDDGTWTVIHSNGNGTVYDGIHHIRKLTVKLIDNPDSGATPEKIISLSSSADDNAGDFYIGADGSKQPVSNIEDYKASDHHTPGGAPVFHNLYVAQKTAPITVKKQWDDMGNMSRIRPDAVNVTIKSDDPDVPDRQIEITKGEDWEKTVTGLPVYSHRYDRSERKPDRIAYSVVETGPDVISGDKETGYEAAYAPASVTLDEDSEVTAELVITNTHEPADGEVDNVVTYGLRGEPQKGEPDYRKVPHNNVTPTELIPPEVEGATLSDDKKTVTIPGQGSYTLNDDGSITYVPDPDFVGIPEPAKVKGIDRKGKECEFGYQPHVLEVSETGTASRTIHFTYETKDGAKVTQDVLQTGEMSRSAVKVDPKTGEVSKWGPWSEVNFPAVPNPAAGEGWYTNDSVKPLTVSEPGAVDDVYVIYHKKEYTVTYENGKHGKSTGGSEKKKYGDTPQPNKVKPKKGYKFTGWYEYVITDENGNVIARGKTKDPQSISVTGNITFTPFYEKAKGSGSGSGKGSGSGRVKTGDDNDITAFSLLGLSCLAALTLLGAKRRKRG